MKMYKKYLAAIFSRLGTLVRQLGVAQAIIIPDVLGLMFKALLGFQGEFSVVRCYLKSVFPTKGKEKFDEAHRVLCEDLGPTTELKNS